MPNLDELIKKYGKEMVSEMTKHRKTLQSEVPRDSDRRPWSRAVQEQKENVESPPVFHGEAWYASWQNIKQTLFKHRGFLLASFFGSLLFLSAIAFFFIPSTFNSTLHLYAPEKTDSISTRLSLFANRVEFASFPVDFKIPLGLIARRLRNEPAKLWVLDQYAKKKDKPATPVLASIVAGETFYAEGSELLVIQGYANDPEVASQLTTLYWDYLEIEIAKMKKEHLDKISHWIDLNVDSIEERLVGIRQELASNNSNSNADARVQLNAKLASDYSEMEVKKIKTQKQLEELKIAADSIGSGHTEGLWAVSHPDVQELRQVDTALKNMEQTEDIKRRRQDLKTQAENVVRRLYEDLRASYNTMASQAIRLKSQIDPMVNTEMMDKRRELLQKQTVFVGQKEELNKLKGQIAVEANIAHTKLRVIQPALPDPTTRRPRLVVKYSVCVGAAFLWTILMLIMAERKVVASRKQSKRMSKMGMSQTVSMGV